MKKVRLVLTVLTVAVLLTPFIVRAQQGAPAQGQGQAGRGSAAPPMPMSFFVSVNNQVTCPPLIS